jgi:hypothetical protein
VCLCLPVFLRIEIQLIQYTEHERQTNFLFFPDEGSGASFRNLSCFDYKHEAKRVCLILVTHLGQKPLDLHFIYIFCQP